MGGSPRTGGMWVEQAPASYFTNDAGRPTSPASDVAFIPSLVQATPMGNSESVDLNDSEKPPALFVRIRFLVAGSKHFVEVPWRRGLTLSQAFHIARTKDSFFRHINPRSFARVVGGQRTRSLSFVLKAGDEVRLNPIAKPML